MKLGELSFLEQVSRWVEEEVFDLESLVVSSEYFDEKEVSSVNEWGEGRILGFISFNLCKSSRRIGEDCIFWSKKLFRLIISSHDECGIGLLKNEALSRRLKMDL